MQLEITRLARDGVDLTPLMRALAEIGAERDEARTCASSPDWSDDHVPDVVEFITDFLKSPADVGGANA